MIKNINFIAILSILCLLVGCVSAEKYNAKRQQTISVKKLQKDINYVQKTLYKRHPDYDYYTTKKDLDYKFDSIRKLVNQPMTSKNFYFLLAPVIADVHQGHMVMLNSALKISKEKKKYYKSMGSGPLSQFDYYWENDKMYVIKNKSENNYIKPGAQLVSINNITPQSISKNYYATNTNDGYVKVGENNLFAKRLIWYYSEELGPLDSVNYVFAQGDSLISTLIKRKAKGDLKPKDSVQVLKDSLKSDSIFIAIKDSLNVTDSAKDSLKKALSKEKKQKLEIENKNKNLYGFNKTKNEYIRSLKFFGIDSQLVYLKITQFSEGQYKKAYHKIFDSVQKAGSKVMVLDLRNNPGGRAAEIVELFKYFSDTAFQMYLPAKVGNKTSLLSPGLYKKSPKLLWPFVSIFYSGYVTHRFLSTQKAKDGYFYYHGLKGQKWTKNVDTPFQGKVYVLINSGSFSAACLIASRLAALPNVTFVGEETGGDFNGTVAGIMPMLTLPNSKLIWRVGLMHIRPVNQRELKGRGVLPEKSFTTTKEDLINNKDNALDWILSEESIENTVKN